jgi:hypothetical protein
MDPKQVGVIAVFAIVFGSMMILGVVRALVRRPRAADSKQLEEISERLARLEQSVDAIAIEAERISEGQRFTTKLLSDRDPAQKVARG